MMLWIMVHGRLRKSRLLVLHFPRSNYWRCLHLRLVGASSLQWSHSSQHSSPLSCAGVARSGECTHPCLPPCWNWTWVWSKVPEGELAKGVRVDIQHFPHSLQLTLLLLVVSHQHLFLLVQFLAETITLPLQFFLQSLVLLGQCTQFSIQNLLIVYSLAHFQW